MLALQASQLLRGNRSATRARFRGGIVALAVLLGSVLLSSCSDGNSSAAATTTTTTAERPESTTSTSEANDRPAIRLAYLASDKAAIEAGAIPDPDFPALAATHVGPMLKQRQSLFRSLRLDGRVIRYPAKSVRRVSIDDNTIDVSDDVAKLEVCAVDDGERIEVKTGRVVASGIGTVLWQVAMQRVDGSWRLAERLELGRWDGVGGCAAR